ncbi:MAG: hypothetical protein JWM10_3813 [Myxococcaceae bacterium]|nr:hypothetical protein [Myxococcaceae bacterium]
MSATVDTLAARVDAGLDPLRDDPEGRFRRREEFYARWGGAGPSRGPGYGASELAFMRWEIDRGLLNATSHPTRPGSPYWRATNAAIARDSELAALAREHGVALPGARWARWTEYLARPSPRRWYRAHTTSLVRAMAAHADDGARESPEERRFINAALYRVLDAEVFVMGGGLGLLGRVLADPRLPAVRVATSAAWLYPRVYPLPAGANPGGGTWRRVERFARRFIEDRAAVDELVRLYLAPLAEHTAGVEALRVMFSDGAALYPCVNSENLRSRTVSGS